VWWRRPAARRPTSWRCHYVTSTVVSARRLNQEWYFFLCVLQCFSNLKHCVSPPPTLFHSFQFLHKAITAQFWVTSMYTISFPVCQQVLICDFSSWFSASACTTSYSIFNIYYVRSPSLQQHFPNLKVVDVLLCINIRIFLNLKQYSVLLHYTYIRSWTVSKIMAR
jgi:hypothetical protein